MKIAILVLAFLNGIWMLFDGCHVLLTGKYFGPPEPGPWSKIVSAVGLDPFNLGPAFVVLGSCWIISTFGLYYGAEWAYWGMLIVAISSLWYVPIGSVISIIVIVLLLGFKSKLGLV